ncbi:hypothetical protein OXB_1589 [Bacillus sp. OxB-1]|uniref:hypothetical protein n=1 Tax=Bacillus sp. (strain OxB-1) TaxID=98228 RepID=UPI0005822EC7|nr:hypothetical protein [Bacillus sp. OxB-1]BAQ10060.1 hypothetical protein OXB_1589 [Bacillus sp. OxB-1]
MHRNQRAAVAPTPAEPSIHMEKLKAQSKMYGTYFMRQLKNPSRPLEDEQTGFPNALISIILFSMLIAGAMYTLIRNVSWSHEGGAFLTALASQMAFILGFIALVLISLYTINHFFGPALTLKSIVSLYGAHLSFLLISAAASLLFILMNSFTFGVVALTITMSLAIFILPLHLVSTLLTEKPAGLDPLYGTLLYVAMFSILLLLLTTIVADSAFGEFLHGLRIGL